MSDAVKLFSSDNQARAIIAASSLQGLLTALVRAGENGPDTMGATCAVLSRVAKIIAFERDDAAASALERFGRALAPEEVAHLGPVVHGATQGYQKAAFAAAKRHRDRNGGSTL